MKHDIIDISDADLELINGGSDTLGDVVRAAGEVAQQIGDAAYEAGYRLGAAVRSLFE